MSQSHRHVTGQNLADFAQFFSDLYVRAGNFMIFLYFMNFLSIITHFMSMFRFLLPIFLRKIFTSKIGAAPKKSTFEMSATMCHMSNVRCQVSGREVKKYKHASNVCVKKSWVKSLQSFTLFC